MTATAAPAPKAPSVWEDFIDIFTSPSDVFARRQNGNWFIPFVVVTVLILVIYLGTQSLTQPVFDAEFNRAMAVAARANPQITPDVVEKQRAFFSKLQAVILPIFVMIGMFFTGVVLWFVGKLFDSTMAFGGGLLVAAYAQFPRIIGAIVGPIIAFFSDPSTLNSATKITASPAHFFDISNTSPVVLALLARFDVFTIWTTILLAIGLSVLGKIPRSRAYTAALIVWILGAVPPVFQAMRSM